MNKPSGTEPTAAIQKQLRQGFDALARGAVDKAAQHCKEVLAAKPDLVQGHFLVGLVALEKKDRKTAFQAFRSVTKLQEDHAPAWAQLAKLFMGDGQVNRADTALARAEQCQSSDPMVLDLMGNVYSLMGDYDTANNHFGRAVQAQPDHPPFLLNYANNLVFQGDSDKAGEVYQRILSVQPSNPQAHFHLASSRKAKNDVHIRQLDQLLRQQGLSPRGASFLYYALGKELEDLEQWQPAIEAFQRGAKARRMTVDYDEAAEVTMYDTLERTYTKDWLANSKPGNPATSPIFVLGQPRTGTTLVERIITSHSQVHSAGELQQLGLAVRRQTQHADPRRFTAELFEKAADLEPEKIGGMYLESTRKMQGDTPRFVDKLPQNFLMVPLILAALPNAKIVHLTRGPMDACFASFKQLFADAYLHSYDQQEMARHHLRYRQLMQTWRERFPDRFFDINYEITVNDLEPNARALIDYLDLPWEDACLNFHQQDAAVATASAAQVREPAHTRSVGRWRHYQQQLAPMLEIIKDAGVDPNSA